jgi:Leucine-rich repeat (LRR) protein
VPDTLANLQQLSYLGIQNTPINKMTDRVTYLYSLKTLSLRNCSLTQMPTLQYMPNLSSVYLPENQLTKLDGLMYVFYLWISDNLFTELPTQLVPERLSYLMMNNNPLKDVTKPRGKKRIFWDLNPKKSEKIPKIRKNLKIQERFSLVNDMILS